MKLVTDEGPDRAYHEPDNQWPLVTSYDGAVDRKERLLKVAGYLRGRLGEREFREIYRLHDHKGTLLVGVRCSQGSLEGLDAVVKEAWELMNEYVYEIYYTPYW